jgi:hypothetical protein
MPEMATHSEQPNTLAAHAAAQPVFTTCATMDDLHRQLAAMPQAEFPVQHEFTPGLYRRTIFMPAGSFLISKIHKTRHPFVVTKGRAKVYSDETGTVEIAAPHHGITEPGTRRLLYILEDMEWATYHATPETDLAAIEALIIQPHNPAMLPEEQQAAAAMLQGAFS